MRDLSYWEERIGKDNCLKYWSIDDIYGAFSCTSYKDLGKVAFEMLKRMPQPIEQVCGPISTGGLGSVDANLYVLDKTIAKLMYNGVIVFNQMPFEGPMQELRRRSVLLFEETSKLLLNDFYLPLFESRLIKKLNFIHSWQSSVGAKWENEQAEKLGIDIAYLPEGFHQDIND